MNNISLVLKRFIAALLFCLFNKAVFGAAIQFSPSPLTVDQSQIFSVDISITDVTDLFAYQFSLNYDPAILKATDITEGDFLSSNGPTFFIPGTIDDVAGYIDLTGDSLISAVSGVSGSGILASLNFIALTSGTSSLTLNDVLALDSNFGDIPVITTNGLIEVNASAIPEPPIIVLLLVGGIGYKFLKRNVLVFATQHMGEVNVGWNSNNPTPLNKSIFGITFMPPVVQL